jgi:hypothetical protein
VKHVVEKIGILVEWLRAHENNQVSGEVTGQKQDQKQAGEGDYELFPDGRGPVTFEAAGKCVHGIEEVAVVAARDVVTENLLFKGRVRTK